MDFLPIEMKAEILNWLHPVMKLFARLVCKEWRELIPYRKPLYQTFWYLLDEDYIELVMYLVERGHVGDLARWAPRKGNMELLEFLRDKIKRWRSNIVANEEVGKWFIANSDYQGYSIYPWNANYEHIRGYSIVDTKSITNVVLECDDLKSLLHLVTRGTHLDLSLFEKAVFYDSLKIAVLLHNYLKIDPQEAFKNAVQGDTRECMSYFSQFVEVDKITVASWLEEPKIKTVVFLYNRGFLSYEACFVFVNSERGAKKLLSWLRGERVIDGVLLPYQNWPPAVMGIYQGDLRIIKWLRSEKRLWGKCPWNSTVLYQNSEITKWARGGDDPCPWPEGMMMATIMIGDTDLLRTIRNDPDPCPWPANIAELVVDKHGLYSVLLELKCPALPINIGKKEDRTTHGAREPYDY